MFFLDKNPATAEKVRLLNETNKSMEVNEFLQHVMSYPVLSKNPEANWIHVHMKIECRPERRNKGWFY